MTAAPESNILPADERVVAHAADILQRGGLVAFPTETVYGLGANALDDAAVAGIFAAKNRPQFNPLIVHVQDFEQASRYALFPDMAARLAAEFWPGPLTLVAPRRQNCPLSLLVSAGLDSVALRAPAHAVAQSLLGAIQLPLAAPSANSSGRLSATSAGDVAQSLGRAVDLIIDDGPCMVGIESTVLGFTDEGAVLLRSGAITREELEPVAGPLRAPAYTQISSPGMLASHYAPNAVLRLNADAPNRGEAYLAFGHHTDVSSVSEKNLSTKGDLREAAANLFSMLRKLDASGAAVIAVAPIPESGLGEAINDRLRRAAAPRDIP